MPCYRLYLLTLESDIPLPELSSGEHTLPDLCFRLATGKEPVKENRQWFHSWTFPNGYKWLLFGREGADFVLHFPDLAEFRVLEDGSTITCRVLGDTPRRTIRHLLLD